MGIKEEAFLAAEMANWFKVNRARNREWFELADHINRIAQEVWNDLPDVVNESSWRFTARLLYLRGITSFQASIILANNGLTVDAGTILRSAFEDLFCLADSRQDEALVAKLVGAQNFNKKKIVRAVAKLPSDLGLEAAKAAKLEEFAKNAIGDGHQLNFAEIAEAGQLKPVYDVYYRSLSHDAAHPTIDSLERLLITDKTGNIIGFATGPDANDIGRTIAYSCVVGFYLVTTMVQLFENTPAHEKISAVFPDYKRLTGKTFGVDPVQP